MSDRFAPALWKFVQHVSAADAPTASERFLPCSYAQHLQVVMHVGLGLTFLFNGAPEGTRPRECVNPSKCCCRFVKTSGKIVNKMGSNLGQIATTAKQAADKIGEQIWGKGRDQ